MKKIGIIGSGLVGTTLAEGFLKHGYQVSVGTRTPSKLDDWKSGKEGMFTGSFADVAAFGEILVLAVKGSVAADALKLAGEKNLEGKTIIDASNPIADSVPENGVLKFFTTMDRSLMETLQEQFPTANFVKAFNSVGSAFMVNPGFKSKPTMFICGNNEKAREGVKAILDSFGWETEDMGTAEAARAIEPLCMLWCIPGFRENRWTHAFKLLRM
jgi:predicted dinucleotide-binding enzyme